MAEKQKYCWLYRKLPSSELKEHVIYKSVPMITAGRRTHPGGWSWLDEANYSPWSQVSRKRQYHREKYREKRENRDKLSRG
tara:strand:+ start:1004 stop:1246 length:243 start_codon:yes stop_codon:yes gene_type:complete